jgi:hypothetical protein
VQALAYGVALGDRMNFRLNADDEVNFDVHSVPTFDAEKSF